MDADRDIRYTEAARLRLDQLRTDFEREVEQAVRDRKFVPGDRFIEVTASDLEELARTMRLEFYDRTTQKRRARQAVLNLYAILGLLTTLIGLFYPSLQEMFKNRTQMLLIVAGAAMTVLSVVMNFALRSFERSRTITRDISRDVDNWRGPGPSSAA